MERARSTERRSWLKHDSNDHPEEPGSRRERAANALDRYSLALQLIQVFPIVSQAAILMVATTWFARALSGTCLLLGTAWVVYLERTRMRRPGPVQGRDVAVVVAAEAEELAVQAVQTVPQDQALPVVTEAAIPHDHRVLHTEVTHHDDGKVHIAISLHVRSPGPSAARARRDVAAHRPVRHRPTPPARPKPLDRSEGGGAVSDGAAAASPVRPAGRAHQDADQRGVPTRGHCRASASGGAQTRIGAYSSGP